MLRYYPKTGWAAMVYYDKDWHPPARWGGTATPETWHHIALVRHGNAWIIYRDSELVTSGTSSISLTGSKFEIGHYAKTYL